MAVTRYDNPAPKTPPVHGLRSRPNSVVCERARQLARKTGQALTTFSCPNCRYTREGIVIRVARRSTSAVGPADGVAGLIVLIPVSGLSPFPVPSPSRQSRWCDRNSQEARRIAVAATSFLPIRGNNQEPSCILSVESSDGHILWRTNWGPAPSKISAVHDCIWVIGKRGYRQC